MYLQIMICLICEFKFIVSITFTNKNSIAYYIYNNNHILKTISLLSMQKSDWTQQEKDTIIQFVKDAPGRLRWSKCAQLVGTKSEKQCYDFYYLQLSRQKKEKKHLWTEQEVLKLLEYGNSVLTWMEFQKQYFPHLSVSQLKNQYQAKTQPRKEAITEQNT